MKKANNNDKNYRFIFNKVFTGSYLDHNLGHEIINFIKTDKNERYVYLNPWGNRNQEHYKKCEYVFHIMKVNYSDENSNYYELLGVSKIDNTSPTRYKTNAKEEEKGGLEYNNHPIYEIFKSSDDKEKAHLYSFKASTFYKVKDNYRVLFTFNCPKPNLITSKEDKNIVKIYVNCYPKRHIAYSKNTDIEVLEELITPGKFLKESNDTIKLEDIDDELCFSVISDRTNLEDSLSNQIAYFLGRDKEILKSFIHLINKKTKYKIEDSELDTIEILREHKNIDLLLITKKHVIVIENKIDSGINGIEKKKKNTLDSQLNHYYQYIKKNFKDLNQHFFILKPEYNVINLEKYANGDKYNVISYDELYKVLPESYQPYSKDDEKKLKRQFLYEQFLESIKYVKSSKAEQKQNIAMIRLNQKIKELDQKK